MRNNWFSRTAAVAAASVALLGIASPAVACNSRNEGRGAFTCTSQNVSVTLQGDSTAYNVVGDLCYNGSPNGKPWEIDVAGMSYNSWYFNPTYKNSKYSSVKAAAKAGLVVFNYDQLGTGGRSDTPAPEKLTLLAHADVLHQLIVKARAGQIGGVSAKKVLVYGHSLGGQEALISQSLNPGDADAVVSIGYMRDANQVTAVKLGGLRVDAATELDWWTLPGFVTTTAAGRDLFHGTTAEAGMIQADKDHRAVTSAATAAQAGYLRAAANRHMTDAIVGTPVLAVSGDNDALGCDLNVTELSCATDEILFTREKPYFPNACLAAYSVSESGHNVGLHRDARNYYDRVNKWKLAALSGNTRKAKCA